MKALSCAIAILIITFHSFSQNVNDTILTSKANYIYDSETIINAYISNRNGIVVYDKPDTNSTKLFTSEYGNMVEIIEIITDKSGLDFFNTKILCNWVAIKVRTQRDYLVNGVQHTSWQWEKLYTQAKNLGDADDIRLNHSDLYKIQNIIFNEKKQVNTEKISELLILNLIDSIYYDSLIKKTHSCNQLLIDSSVIIKKQNGIELLIGKNLKNRIFLKENLSDTNYIEYVSYAYLGRFNSIKQILILGMYYENWSYIFYDIINGRKKYEFIYFPVISCNNKKIVTVGFHPYLTATIIETCIITNKHHFKPSYTFTFDKWVPINEPVWISENEIIFKVVHIATYGGTIDENQSVQYLKITILY